LHARLSAAVQQIGRAGHPPAATVQILILAVETAGRNSWENAGVHQEKKGEIAMDGHGFPRV